MTFSRRLSDALQPFGTVIARSRRQQDRAALIIVTNLRMAAEIHAKVPR